MIWFILLIIGICSIISIFTKEPAPILTSLGFLGIYLLFSLIEFIGEKVTEGDRIERFFSSIFHGFKFIYINIKPIAIGSIILAVAIAIVMFNKSTKSENVS